ncbi:MAG: A/G-specific adenine glycosylase [Ilumatobacteraceae bacterium]|nr:A/G-specific adenine glycosylase [Ilumatobacteraceae bacterium]
MQEAAARRVLSWGLAQLRDLPWRQTRDPWAVLVSEVMLQQTQVDRVVPRWFEFLETYPTAEACAGAGLGDVLRLWQGLGYPRRARNLHAAAQRVAELGEFPRTLEGLLALPGVGPYTARALLAFAFEEPAAVVDTNIARVFARVAGHRLTAREVQALADGAVPGEQVWAWNQCLMDLGAVLCRPSSPRCTACPLLADCAYHGVGDDPAPGSAGVSVRQSPFEGSDRQGRGRLMKALGSAPVHASTLAAVMQWPDQTGRAQAAAASLLADRLIVFDASTDTYRLP